MTGTDFELHAAGSISAPSVQLHIIIFTPGNIPPNEERDGEPAVNNNSQENSTLPRHLRRHPSSRACQCWCSGPSAYSSLISPKPTAIRRQNDGQLPPAHTRGCCALERQSGCRVPWKKSPIGGWRVVAQAKTDHVLAQTQGGC